METISEQQPEVVAGMHRQWVRCIQCGNVAYYDYQPGSLANPLRSLPCGHGFCIRFDEAVDFITAAEAAKEK